MCETYRTLSRILSPRRAAKAKTLIPVHLPSNQWGPPFSDQGDQHTSLASRWRCEEAGLRHSVGSVWDCYDNAIAEGFFARQECELLDRIAFCMRAEAERAIFELIEGWHNP